MKERVTLTIDKNLLEKVDQCIDGSKIKNRSHACELLLLKAFSSNRPRKAIILAGGSDPKFLQEIKGKKLIEWNIELLKRHGVKHIMICINENDKETKNILGDGKSFGLFIDYNEEKFPLGTSGSIKAVSDFVTETVIILNADELKNIDLDDMYVFHTDGHKICTIALTTVHDPNNFGVAMLNGNRIITFVEKPLKEKAPSKLVNAGLYIIEPEVLKYIPDGFSRIEQDVFPKLATEDKLWGYIFSGQWFSTKTTESFNQALVEWKGL
ncbi:TPA: nucleotidyltransferase family protein [Candidatus Woesearchaeota archaeon]|nr:nucleotidyltransferase family protein [Candidatus Woesearchaeota archaeon]HIH32350.1 nucleotidyltransferase family protein [Candidatus Woesearchaeota archaeon]HIH54468.1 nucleotidyltransferase family protein [Candidatus Woesearchaeota archaeon]HIJ01724.1 nucleotidyltransferase family protein [Candidatus Woesearchaeota archaeon]HIJ14369.1 nucleotidyltransferase family protein [Candidatus Woesearchaeota archaeon]